MRHVFVIVLLLCAFPASAQETSVELDPRLLLDRAAKAGRESRHEDAIRDYEAVLEMAPERRAEIAGPLAYQYAWAGKLAKAKASFQEALAAKPGDLDLILGLLLVTNWMGDHLEAWAAYDELAARYPQDARMLVGRATAQHWLGRHDLALATLREARAIDAENRDVSNMETAVRSATSAQAAVFYDWSEDSDDLQINGLWAEESFYPNSQLRLTPYLNVLGIRRPASPDIDETWLGVTAWTQPWTRVALHGRLSVLLDPPSGSDYSPVTYDLGVDHLLNDRWRGGLTLARFLLLSYNVLPEKVDGHTWGAWVEMRPDWLTRLRGAADVGFYDAVAGFEDNRHVNLWLGGSREVWAPARVRVGAIVRYLDFEKQQDIGIWNPDSYWAVAGTGEFDWGIRDRWSLNGGVELGPSQEKGGDVTAYASWRLGAYRTMGRWSVEGSAGHSEGNVGTWRGFDRSWARLGVRFRF